MQENVSGNVSVEQASQPEPNVQEQFIHANEAQAEQPAEQSFDEAKYRQIAREEAAKVAQSFTDKATDRINKHVQKQIEALETSKSVLGLSDEQVEAAKQKIVVDASLRSYGTNETAKAHEPQETPASETERVQPATPSQSNIHPIVANALNMMQEAKMTIEEGDPEFEKFIKPHFARPDVTQSFLIDTARAIDAKAARLAEQQENAAIRTAGGAPGSRVPANDISNITDSAELYRIGEQRLRERKR